MSRDTDWSGAVRWAVIDGFPATVWSNWRHLDLGACTSSVTYTFAQSYAWHHTQNAMLLPGYSLHTHMGCIWCKIHMCPPVHTGWLMHVHLVSLVQLLGKPTSFPYWLNAIPVQGHGVESWINRYVDSCCIWHNYGRMAFSRSTIDIVELIVRNCSTAFIMGFSVIKMGGKGSIWRWGKKHNIIY